VEGYQLGKDIQEIKERLKRLEEALAYHAKSDCSCGKEVIDEATVSDSGESSVEQADGSSLMVRFKTFTFSRTGRLGYCNWKKPETVKIHDTGLYTDTTRVSCEHGYLFSCFAASTILYEASNGEPITSTG